MRMNDYLAQRDPAEAEALVNALTVGLGTLAQVVRRMSRDEEQREIVALLATAALTLDRAYGELPGAAKRALHPAVTRIAVGLPWSAHLAGLPAAEQTALRSRLQLVVMQARVTGELVQANGEVAEVVRLLGGVLDHLDALRRELAPPLSATDASWRPQR